MGLLSKLRGEFVDIIEWTEPAHNDILAYRFPRYNNEIKNGAQLTVREGQNCVFVNEGQLADVFKPGMVRLETANLPILSTLKGWKFGFNSPFKAEVYFISTRQWTDQKWGTQNPFMMRDPEFGPIRVRAFGSYAFRVSDPGTFLKQLVATDPSFETYEIATQLRNVIVSRFIDVIGTMHIPILDLAGNYEKVSVLASRKDRSGTRRNGFGDHAVLRRKRVAAAGSRAGLSTSARRCRCSAISINTPNTKRPRRSPRRRRTPAAWPAWARESAVGAVIGGQMAGAIVPSAAPPIGPPPLPQAASYFAGINGQQVGPLDMAALAAKVRENSLTAATLCLEERHGELDSGGNGAGTADAICQCAAAVSSILMAAFRSVKGRCFHGAKGDIMTSFRRAKGDHAYNPGLACHHPQEPIENQQPTVTNAPARGTKVPLRRLRRQARFRSLQPLAQMSPIAATSRKFRTTPTAKCASSITSNNSA